MALQNKDEIEPNNLETFCVILPAAGFGMRMGQPESKEMMVAPNETNPLIQFALDLFCRGQHRVVVPTRAEKKNLISFLQTHYPQVVIQIIPPSQEWPDTILQTKPHWLEKNILVLPDTRWSPVDAVFQVMNELEKGDCAFSTFADHQLENWGVFCSEPIAICDKPPQHLLAGNMKKFYSWGHIAFRQSIGEQIFSSILRSHQTKSF